MHTDIPNKINGLTYERRSLKNRMPRMNHRFHPHEVACNFLMIVCLPLFLILAQSSSAQTVQSDQAELARSQAPFTPNSPGETVDGHAAPSPNDADLGEQQILKRTEGYQPFTISVGAPFYWTSNVALSNSGEQSDFIVAPVAGIFNEPRITQTLYGLIDVREQLFYYDQFDGFDFGSFDFEIGLRYTIPQWHNLLVRAEYDYNRLTKKDSFDDFYSNHAFIASAEIPFKFGRAQQVSLGVDVDISMAAAQEAPRRNDYEAYIAYSANLARAFSLNAVGRFVVRDYYHQNSRVDVSEILAVSANYKITKFLTASAVGTFAASQSNHSVFDYEVGNAGGAVSLAVKF